MVSSTRKISAPGFTHRSSGPIMSLENSSMTANITHSSSATSTRWRSSVLLSVSRLLCCSARVSSTSALILLSTSL